MSQNQSDNSGNDLSANESDDDDSFDKLGITIKCPVCGDEFFASFGNIKRHDYISCSRWHPFDVSVKREKLLELEETARKYREALLKLGE